MGVGQSRRARPQPDHGSLSHRTSPIHGEVSYKIVIMGDSRTGKTCCMERFSRRGVFHLIHVPTIEVEYRKVPVMIDDAEIGLHLWETGGLETFRTLSESFYRNSHGFIAVYDVTKRRTFESIPHWIEKSRRQGDASAPVLLLGNKCDKGEREVDYETAKNFADEHSLVEVSAMDGTNTEFALMTLVAEIREKRHDPEKIDSPVEAMAVSVQRS